MKGKKWLILVIGLGVVLLSSSIGVTRSSFVDLESSSGNTLQAWTSTKWVQTTQADFEAGVLNNVDTWSSPGDVKLGSVSEEPTTSIGSEGSWYYTSWSRRAPLTISNPGSGLTDYQVRVDVTYDADMQPDFDDIRFVDSDDSTELSHWRESYTASTSATFWVKVPSIPSGTKTIYMYYGNATASSASDGNATFVFFDDFLGTSLDGTKWWWWDATVSVSDSVVTITNTGAWGGIISQTEYTLPYRFVGRAQKTTTLGIGQVGLEKWYVSTGDDTINVFDVWGTERPQVYYTSKYDGTEEWDEVGTWNLSTWYHYEIKGKSDEVKYYRDGALQNTEITLTAIPVGLMGVLLSSEAINDQLLVDYCFISKYASPEPTASVGSEDGWSRRAPVTINNPGSSLTDYQVRVDITYDTDMQPDFDDIRFVDSDDSTELSHWRESYTASTSAIFWVKVPSIPSGSKTIYMYYGNAAASSASDGNATFVFFDDFDDASLGADWTFSQVGGAVGSYAESGTVIRLTGTDTGDLWDSSDKFLFLSISGNYDNVLIESYTPAWGGAHGTWSKMGGVQLRQSVDAGSKNRIMSPVFSAEGATNSYRLTTGGITDEQTTTTSPKYNRVSRTGGTSRAWYSTDGITWTELGSQISFTGGLTDPVYLAIHLAGLSTAEHWVEVDWFRVRKYPPPSTYVSPGTIASDVLDTGVTGARWDALFWDETLQTNTDITFEVRASDTVFLKDAATPSWTPVGGTSPVTSGLPSGQYKQWRATLTTSDTSKTPTLHEVRVYHY